MRRCVWLLSLIVAAAHVAPGYASSASPKAAALQLALGRRGYYTGALDGIAGPRTRAATRRFQRRAHLQVDGIAGPKTRAKLGSWARPELGTRILRQGLRGWDVAELQFLLRRNGVSVTVDGEYGPITEAAILGTQRGVGLAADGLVGPRTLEALRDRRGRLARLRVEADVRAAINRWSRYYGVEGRLARALAWMESGDQPDLTSASGAWGVFQIMPTTWRYVEQVLTGRHYPHTIEGNIRVGLLYLRHLMRAFDAVRPALAAWYTGPATVRRYGITRRGRWFVAGVLALRART
jgi:hypothetical protein